ncbi:Variant SH3 domain-containing protein 1 [Elsinoe fawcettii]|nr:Variant SH3 domain-containing protein 1 [Elsinoe fawcettii]
MARQGTDPQQVPPGSTLIVIHDFVARSPDELSLSKGDKIELIERDDDFGDGWFLGKHLANGNTGLFPEVYTRPAPKGVPGAGSIGLAKLGEDQHKRAGSEDLSVSAGAQQGQDTVRSSAPESLHSSFVTSQNPVMNETLDVIKEHINDMNTPRQSLNRGPSHDSTSVYAQSQSDARASYIRGHETDEEDTHLHTEKEVLTWTPTRVAEYLEDKGVERQHCDVFMEQEISGEVLLNMEQSSIFIKEFDLGSVGRRLKTWQKVKALQDEVRASSAPNVPRSISNYSVGGDESADGALVDPARQRSSSMATTTSFLSPNMQQGQKMQTGTNIRSNTIPFPTHSTSPQPGSPLTGRPELGPSRPSAQHIRAMQHTRRHSSLGSDVSMQRVMLPPGAQVPPHAGKVSHERVRSSSGFDASQAKRASKFGHAYSLSSGSHVSQAPTDWGLGPMGSPSELDRGYFSGNEVDKRNHRRSVLQKKSIASASHSRNPSETTDNIRTSYQSQPKMDSPLSPTVTNAGIFSKMKGNRSASSPKTFGKTFGKDMPTSPVVTRLDYDQRSPAFNGSEASSAGHSPSAGTFSFFSKPKATGLRVASDSAAVSEKSANTSKPSPLNSPTRTGSTTPSTESRSINDPAKSDPSRLSTGSSQNLAGAPPVTVLPAPRTRPRARSKKFTSAYTRGLEKKSPRDQMIGADYSGWMKKKSASLVGTWKPRLFVLRGRRLSYYYSETDTEEKGLIDISGHRVLPAENERMTGLHATLTGAKSPQTPDAANLTTNAAMDLAAGKAGPDGDEGLFIFKLVPPRQGMSKAVNFTKPVVHYFAVGSRAEGRLWMAALMKATIDYDASGKVTTSYNQPTISLKKARERRERPPALREEGKVRDAEGKGRQDSAAGPSLGDVDLGEERGLGIDGLDTGAGEEKVV